MPLSERTAPYLKEQGEKDTQGVIDADVMVLLNSAKSEGKAVEQGIAIAMCIPIIAIGERGAQSNNVFHYMDDYTWVPTAEAAIERIRR